MTEVGVKQGVDHQILPQPGENQHCVASNHQHDQNGFSRTRWLTSDLVDHQVHLPVGPFSQFTDHLIVFVDVQFLQVLHGDQLEFLQDVGGGGGAGAVGRGAHGRGLGSRSGLETVVPEVREGKVHSGTSMVQRKHLVKLV